MVVGLGNPGAEYARTRHNAGFMAVDALAGAEDWKSEKNYLIKKTEPRTTVTDTIFIKPQTFMNLSGAAVLSAMTKYKIPIERVVVIHDDIDLKLGDVRTKVGGGNAGHNGLKSIDAAIGRDYARIRLGIGRPENPEFDVADWVVGKFAKSEMEIISDIIENRIPKLLYDPKP